MGSDGEVYVRPPEIPDSLSSDQMLDGSESLPITCFPDRYGLNEKTHLSVLEELDKGFEQSLPNFHQLAEEGVLPDSEIPEAEVGEYMKALRRVDGRSWHDRGIDVLMQWHMPKFERGDVNVLVAETNYNYTRFNSPASFKRGVVKSDIDFMAAKFEENQITANIWEAKTREEDLRSSDQALEHANSLLNFGEKAQVDVYTVRGNHGIYAYKVQNLLESIDEGYGIPRGYVTEEELVGDSIILIKEEVSEMGSFENFLNNFIGIDYFGNEEMAPNVVYELKEIDQEELVS